MRGSASDIFTKWRKPRASRGAIAVALVLHAGLMFMIGSIVFSYPLREFLRIPDWSKEPPPERIQYVRMVPATGASQALISLFSAMNFVLGLRALWPAIGT